MIRDRVRIGSVLRLTIGALMLAPIPASSTAARIPPGKTRLGIDGTWQRTSAEQRLRPADGKALPFTAAGRASYESNAAARARKDFAFDRTTARCSSPGLPRLMMAPGRFKVYARADAVVLLFEWNRLFRQISLGKPRQPAPADTQITFDRARDELLFGTMMGKSYGKSEAGQLVVTSDGFSAKKLLDDSLPSSEDLKLTERFRLIGKNILEDRIRIEDPKNFTRPWEAVLTYRRVPDAPFPEDVCLDRKRDGQQTWPR